jgi:hypothetical protein
VKDLWAELQEAGHLPMRRAVTFAAALAINQGSPHIALELLSDLPRQNYVTVRNLKVRVNTQLIVVSNFYSSNQVFVVSLFNVDNLYINKRAQIFCSYFLRLCTSQEKFSHIPFVL